MTKLAKPDPETTLEPETQLARARAGLQTIMEAKDSLVRETFDAQENLKVFKKLSILSQDTINDAESVTIDVKKTAKRLKAQRDAALQPLNEIVELVKNLYKPVLTSLDTSEKELKARISKGIVYLRDAQSRALKTVSTLSSAGSIGPARQVLLNMPDAQLPKNTSIREIWKWELKDIEKVPVEHLLLVVNSTSVEAAIEAGAREIPGLRVYKVDSVTIRTKS